MGKWALSKDTVKQFDEVLEKLHTEFDDMSARFEDMSETWKESEEGMAVSEWLGDLDRLMESRSDYYSAQPEE